MKRGALLLPVILLTFGLGAQESYVSLPPELNPEVCVGNPVNSFFVVPAPEKILSRLKSGYKTANIEVTYTGFSDQAKAAFQSAVDIWSVLISSPVTIHIQATWEPLGTNILGSCSPAGYYTMLEGSRDLYKFYPVALAEKLVGHDLNGPNDPDIVAHFNSSNTNWSYATDGKPVANKYDLVTIVLHEICHGLGFVGSMYVDNSGIGSYGFGLENWPAMFDKYVSTGGGTYLIDTNSYDNNSLGLATVLQSDNLYFQSPIAKKINSGKAPKLYDPVKWSGGSSVYHLDDGRYDNTQNALMTHALSYAEVVHDPGPLVMAMMDEIGWVHTWIEHDTIHDLETITAPVPVVAKITSDTLYFPQSVMLHYSTDHFATGVTIPMSPDGTANEYASSIPVPLPETRIDYYISVVDTFQRVYTSPSAAPAMVHSFYYGKDTVSPVIRHQPVTYLLAGIDSLVMSAVVTDNLGLKKVYINYLINGVPQDSIVMQSDSLDKYTGVLVFQPGSIAVGDSISYRIVAIDASKQSNTTRLPSGGYYTFRVEEVPAPQTEYSNNFDQHDADFIMNGFSVDKPDVLSSPGLNSAHPYSSPNIDGGSFNFTSQLRIPIVLRPGDAYMKFDEIALVEPGENGSLFGDAGFYDYVVVEGSKDGGHRWIPFQDGWDCRAWPEWLTRWNSNVDGKGNSRALADDGLFRSRKINMLGNASFSGGDTVLIRFRLYSDPYSNGWGWVIDNLGIQGTVSEVKDLPLEDMVTVFPNPVSDFMTVRLTKDVSCPKIYISLTNLVGQEVCSRVFDAQPAGFDYRINTGELKSGLYLLNISAGDFIGVRKIVIRK